MASRPGISVSVVSPVPFFPRWLKTERWRAASTLPDEESMGGLTVYHPRYFLLPKVSMPIHGASMFLGSLSCVRALHRKAKIDCIDAHFVYPDGLAAVLLGKALDVPVVVSARGTDINLFPSFRLIRPMIRWTLDRADAIVAVSAALREAMVALGTDREKIHLIPNAIDSERFRRIPAEEARRELGLPERNPLVISVGSLIPSKGHQFLIRAVGSIASKVAGIQLYILGEGPYRTELEQLTRELGLEKLVHLVGKHPNEELPLWFSSASLSCLASSREGWPNVITESLACGTPVVATRVGGIPEILHSPDLGILVEQSSEAIAAGIQEALAKNWDREEISRRNSSRTWKTVAEEVETVLLKQTQSRGASAREGRKG